MIGRLSSVAALLEHISFLRFEIYYGAYNWLAGSPDSVRAESSYEISFNLCLSVSTMKEIIMSYFEQFGKKMIFDWAISYFIYKGKNKEKFDNFKQKRKKEDKKRKG